MTVLSDRSSCRRCSIKKLFLKISHYSNKNTCIGVLFNTVWDLQTCKFIKKRFQTQVFCCEYCEIFKIYFEEHLRMAVSGVIIRNFETFQKIPFEIFEIFQKKKTLFLLFFSLLIILNYLFTSCTNSPNSFTNSPYAMILPLQQPWTHSYFLYTFWFITFLILYSF